MDSIHLLGGPEINGDAFMSWDANQEWELNGDGEGQDEERPKVRRLVDIIPKSLETLILFGCQGQELAQSREVLSRRERVAPALESVKFTYKKDRPPDIDELSQTEAECGAAGIKFVIEHHVHYQCGQPIALGHNAVHSHQEYIRLGN